MVYDVSERVGWRDEKGTVVLVDLNSGQVSTFENAARLIWLELTGHQNFEAVTDQIASRFNLPRAEAADHLDEFLRELLREGWISKSEG